jgi:hypothetical protein
MMLRGVGDLVVDGVDEIKSMVGDGEDVELDGRLLPEEDVEAVGTEEFEKGDVTVDVVKLASSTVFEERSEVVGAADTEEFSKGGIKIGVDVGASEGVAADDISGIVEELETSGVT